MDIGTLIKTLRKKRGLTQVNLAKKLGMTQKAVCDYERGTAKPSRERLPKLSAILGISVDELLGTAEVNVSEEETQDHVHGNSRIAKLQEQFEKLSSFDQRAVLKHVDGLIARAESKNNGKH
jgi:transcriptional regulator with XRE-family HTH domain